MQLAAGVSCRKCKGSRGPDTDLIPDKRLKMTSAPVPPAPPAARPASLRGPFRSLLEDTGSHLPRPGRGPSPLAAREAGRVAFPNPSETLGSLSCPSEASGNILMLSTLDSSRAQVPEVTVSGERSHPSIPANSAHVNTRHSPGS